MKKQVISILLILCFAFAFTGCNKDTTSTAVTIGICEVSSDIFAYYLDLVMQNKDDTYEKDSAIGDAESQVKHYVLINTAFEELGLSLTSGAKLNAADEVNSIWKLYGDYYKKIGVSKETLTKIKWSESYEEELINKIFGAGGEQEISEDDQKTYFNEHYVFFKVLIQSFSGDATSDEALATTFEEMKNSINADNTIESINNQYLEKTGLSEVDELAVSSTKEGSLDYPETFFTEVKALEVGAVAVIKTDNYIFLVQKVDFSTYFTEYQREVLADMAEVKFEETMSSTYGDITVTGSSLVETSCYNTIVNVKSK